MTDYRLDAHLLICTHRREGEECCQEKGSEALVRELKEFSKELRNSPGDFKVRVNVSGCLGHCKRGITAVLYPQGEWFFFQDPQKPEGLKLALEAARRSAKTKTKD